MIKSKFQRVVKFLSLMIMTNIGVFIAWGLITLLVIPKGFFHNEALGSLADSMVKYLFPLIVSIKGGNMISGYRGGIIAAVATMGVIVGTDIPMMIGAMILGPLAAYIIKAFDKVIENRIPEGFEMLVNNFSIGAISMILAIIGFMIIKPITFGLLMILKSSKEFIVSKGLIPSIFIISFVALIIFLRVLSIDNESKEEVEGEEEDFKVNEIENSEIKKIVFACDAGMESSAMGATKFRKRIKSLGLNIEVTNSSVDSIPQDADLVISHINLLERAKRNSPNAEHIFIEDFFSDNKIDKLFERLEENMLKSLKQKLQIKNILNATEEKNNLPILSESNILLGLESESKEDAIKRAGELLVKGGYVNENYIEAMLERERVISTYIGMGVAIPHGIGEAKKNIKASGIVVIQYPEGVDFGEELAYLVIGIAGVGDEHLEILSNIAISLEDIELVDRLNKTRDKKEILDVFKK
ncbi:PTS sugar transporter subunit IIA [Clostridium sp. DSM 100503]|uniref:PTS sugar transporter subunit IIA n=1 Tax=Clostridium sp. DSM 100503 TaxID=2963282 RepID=UPI00214A76C4|nr:PTS sugar transporter subunit IIA [Clostridium sp. DSM 100503]MCR1952097.1 PTS sugar transporter subunit IIA [Clostridium sp. DSM 100503]